MKKTILLKFFNDRPSLSIRQFGIEAGYSDGKYLRRYLANEHSSEDVPQAILNRVVPLMRKYGWMAVTAC